MLRLSCTQWRRGEETESQLAPLRLFHTTIPRYVAAHYILGEIRSCVFDQQRDTQLRNFPVLL